MSKAAYWLIGSIYGAEIDYLKYKEIDQVVLNHKKGLKGKLDQLAIDTFYQEEEKRRRVWLERIQSTEIRKCDRFSDNGF